MKGRVTLLGDFNMHSLESNLHCSKRRNVAGLEALLGKHDLILNNEPGKPTKSTQRNTTSIIDLMITTPVIGALYP